MTATTYIGLGQFAGWEFSLTPIEGGFLRKHIKPANVWFSDMRAVADHYERRHSGWTERRIHEINNKPDDTVEAEWLTQWPKRNLIRAA